MALTAFGAAGGPVVGIFFLGFVFPQANYKVKSWSYIDLKCNLSREIEVNLVLIFITLKLLTIK